MTHVLRAFSAFMRVGIGTMIQYRGEILLWAIWGLVNPAVLYALWSAAAQTHENGEVAGYGRGEFAAYFFMMMIVGHMTTAWDTYEMGSLVRSGTMSPKLLRPVLPIWEALASNLSYKLVTLVFVVPMWILFALIVRPTFDGNAWQVALGVVSVLLAGAANFVLGYCVALIAFWSPKLDATGEVFFGVGMFFGGRFSPLAALPPILGSIATLLPFRWMFAFPADLTIGKIDSMSEALAGLAMQCAWLGMGIVGFRLLWRAAVKRYTAVSG